MIIAPARPPTLSSRAGLTVETHFMTNLNHRLVRVHAYDGKREVWADQKYLFSLDLSPEATGATARRLNRIAQLAADYERVHSDPAAYVLEIIDFHSDELLFRWIYVPEERT